MTRKKLMTMISIVAVFTLGLVPGALAQNAASSSWNTTLAIACPGSEPCSYSITAFNTDGSTAGTYNAPAPLPAHGSTTVALSAVIGGSSSFSGSAIVSSNREVAVTAIMYADNTIDREFYAGYTEGATTVYMATVLGHIWSQNHAISIQNLTSSPVTGNILYYPSGSTTASATFPYSLNGSGSVVVDTSASAPDGPGLTAFNGSAMITATGEIAAVVHGPNYLGADAVAFEHSLPGNTTLYYPTALGGVYGAQLATFFAIQNVGDAPTTLTATFSAGGTDYITTTVLGPNAKWTLYPLYPSQVASTPALPSGFSGALTIQSSSQPIAGVSNQKAMNATKAYGCLSTQHQMMEYTAQGPAASTPNQVIPYASYSNSSTGWTTYIAAQNVETADSITVTATFYNADGTMLTASGGTNPLVFTNVTPGGKAAPIWPYAVNSSLTSWTGSVVIEATGAIQVSATNKQVNNCNAGSVLGQAFTP